MKVLLVLSLAVFIGACSTHQSPMQQEKGEKFLFEIDNEEAVFDAAYKAISEAEPAYSVSDLDGPVRGYKMFRRPFLDHYTTLIRIFPVSGVTLNGRQVNGYYPEVSGSGTLFGGPSFDKKVYRNALDKFGKLAPKVKVVSIERTKYQKDRDRWRLSDTPSLRDGGSIKIEGLQAGTNKSVTERLNELEELKKSGAISNQEFDKLRIKILNDI